MAQLAQLLLFALSMLAPAAHALETVTLQLKWTHAFQFAGYYLALERGYYREAGLDVKIREASPGASPVDAVLASKAQFGVGMSSLLLDRQKGKPVVALAVIFQHSPQILIQAQKRGSNSVHDLAGRRIMLEPHADELLAYLQHESIDLTHIIRQPHSFDIKDLLEGRTDAMSAYLTNEPFFLRRQGFSYQSLTPRASGIDFYGDNLFTSQREIDRNPARVAAFREASLRGWREAMAEPETAIKLIREKYAPQLDEDFLRFEAKAMAELLRADLIEVGYMNPGRWRHIATTYAELGLLPPDIDLTGFLYAAPTPYHIPAWAIASLVLVLLAGLVAAYVARINRRLSKALVESSAARQSLSDTFMRLEQAEGDQRRMMSLASHEFRTPTAMIQASLDSLQYLKDAIPPAVQKRLDNIRKGSERLERIANRLIEFERLHELALHPKRQSIELAPFLRQIANSYSTEQPLQGSWPNQPITLDADPLLLGVALHNLLDNALRHHIPTNGMVTLSANQESGAIIIRVTDRGFGVSDADKALIFRRFHSTRNGPGGLGLTIVASIAEGHGWGITVTDNPAGGAVFSLEIPEK